MLPIPERRKALEQRQREIQQRLDEIAAEYPMLRTYTRRPEWN